MGIEERAEWLADVDSYLAMCEEARGQLKRLRHTIEEGVAGLLKKEELVKKMRARLHRWRKQVRDED
jgi:hypothetical protein